MFNQLHIPSDQISAESQRIAQALEASMGAGTDAAQFAARVIAQRLRNHPHAYLEFGPYWWAVKAALRAHGEEFGAADDATVRVAYAGELPPLDSLAAGELFKDHYRRNWLAGNAQFWLDDEAQDSYVLFDADMEARRLGRGALAVGANLAAQPEPSEPENPPADGA